jgi:hypothetical protein
MELTAYCRNKVKNSKFHLECSTELELQSNKKNGSSKK